MNKDVPIFPPNELKTELLSIHALNPFCQFDSSSRSTMFAGHICQRLVTETSDEKIIQSGAEQEFGKYTFKVKMPENGRILRIIKKFPPGISQNSINFNPEVYVIYEIEETKEIDYFVIPYHASYHQYFGFKYNEQPDMMKIKTGAYIAKDTVFADSPNVGENNNYKYGINANVAFMSVPSVSEDGMMVSRDFLDKFSFRVYEKRTVEFGSSTFPLNMYGFSLDNYKCFPDIGEYLRPDGILMMLRKYDTELSPVQMSVYDTLEPDYIFDKAVYARGGNGRVIDIRVISNNSANKNMPELMTPQINKYKRSLVQFYQEIINTEIQIRNERHKKYEKGEIRLTPKFHRLMVEALAITNFNGDKLRQSLTLMHRKNPIDEYMVEFTIEYVITPSIGFKLTDCHGGKGVICKIEEPENMPVDADGNRADIVTDNGSIINRMNIGRYYEHYLCSASRKVKAGVREILNIPKEATNISIDDVESFGSLKLKQAMNYLLGFYNIVSSRQFDFYSKITDEEIIEHIHVVVNKEVYIYYPVENEKDIIEMIDTHLEKSIYKPTHDVVSFVGNSGVKSVTKDKIRIAPLYLMALDKIADDWSSVSTGKIQHFGVLSPLSKSEKFAYPYRNSPVRTIGETEGRIFVGYCGREALAEMMDRSNSPLTQRHLVWNLLDANFPTNVESLVDRDSVSLGGSKPIQLVKHMLFCSGVVPIYEPEE